MPQAFARIFRVLSRRRVVAGLAALALVLQGLSLYVAPAPSPEAAAYKILANLPGVSQTTPILCLNVDEDGRPPVHHHGAGDCPMCALVGASLAGAPSAALSAPMLRVASVVDLRVSDAARRNLLESAARSRGPPALG